MQCKIVFGDDFGDNSTTFKCDLPTGHTGRHSEHGNMGTPAKPQPYVLEWEGEGENYDFVDE